MSEEYSIDNIETKVMSILYANIDTTFNQFGLFNKLVKDKFPDMFNTSINPSFKAKFLLVLRNLMTKYDDIKVTKDSGNIYSVVCFSDKNKTDFKNWIPESQCENSTMNLVNTIGSNPNSIPNPNPNSIPNPNPNPNSNSDYSHMLDYIIENNLDEDLNYIDPFDGNTIYHDLVVTKNINRVETLVSSNKFNYFIKNKYDKTPMELCTCQAITNILITGLIKKYVEETENYNTIITSNKNKINELENRVKIFESKEHKNNQINQTSIIDFLWIKIYYNLLIKINITFIGLIIMILVLIFWSK